MSTRAFLFICGGWRRKFTRRSPPLVFGKARNWGAWQPNMSPYDNVIVFVDNDIVFVNTNIIFADHNIVFADKQAIFANNGLVFATSDVVFSDTNVNSLRKKVI